MTIAHIESNMARTRFSVTKALKRKQVNLNNSDVHENNCQNPTLTQLNSTQLKATLHKLG